MSNYPNKKNFRDKNSRSGEGKPFRPRSSENRPPRREENTVPENIVAGRNSVRELLKSGRSVDKLFVRSGDREGSITVIVAEAIRMGIPVIEALVKEREENGNFKNLKDFVERMTGKGANKRTIESFIKAGALDTLKGTRKQFMMIYVKIVDQISQEKKYSMTGQMSLFDMF